MIEVEDSVKGKGFIFDFIPADPYPSIYEKDKNKSATLKLYLDQTIVVEDDVLIVMKAIFTEDEKAEFASLLSYDKKELSGLFEGFIDNLRAGQDALKALLHD